MQIPLKLKIAECHRRSIQGWNTGDRIRWALVLTANCLLSEIQCTPHTNNNNGNSSFTDGWYHFAKIDHLKLTWIATFRVNVSIAMQIRSWNWAIFAIIRCFSFAFSLFTLDVCVTKLSLRKYINLLLQFFRVYGFSKNSAPEKSIERCEHEICITVV